MKMSEENKAAQVDPLDKFVQEEIDRDEKETQEPEQKAKPSESAPEDAEKPETTEAEKPTEDGFQKRINKVTADKYAEKKRADDLQKRLDEMASANAKPALKEPKLEDPEIGYDTEKLEAAQLKYQIQQGVDSELAERKQTDESNKQQVEAKQVADTFNEQVKTLGKEDFDSKADSIPELPPGVAFAMMQMADGADLIYHLGSHLDKAESISNMSPALAMMEIGKLSAQLSVKPDITPSAAPDPITPLSSGSALQSEIGDEMPIDEWMSTFN
jgi:hypothetical protein